MQEETMMLFYRGLENEEHLAFLFHWSDRKSVV